MYSLVDRALGLSRNLRVLPRKGKSLTRLAFNDGYHRPLRAAFRRRVNYGGETVNSLRLVVPFRQFL
jgi:hypothetical protein